jgi:hypothetical protein
VKNQNIISSLGHAVCAAALLLVTAHAAPEKGSSVEKRKNLSWQFEADPALPDVLILGDSISIGYTLPVRELLEGKANVYRPMSPNGKGPENCAGTTAGVAGIDGWLGDRKWKVIHFNWGLHDLKHIDENGGPSNDPASPVQASPEVYAENLGKIVAKLEATGARLIFATTTPVVPNTKDPLRAPEAPGIYNAAARKVIEGKGIQVNDLHAFCEPRLAELQLPRNVHFNEAGSMALAKEVADAITRELEP